MNTTFDLVVSVQVHENHAWVDGKLNVDKPYWKPKGGREFLVRQGMSIEEASGYKPSELEDMASKVVDDANSGVSGVYFYSNMDFTLVEKGPALIEEVFEFISKFTEERVYFAHDLGSMRWRATEDMTECAFDWAVKKLVEAGRIELSGHYLGEYVEVL
jgi:hypothetical protein